MKIALGVSLLSGVALIVLYGIVVGVMVPGWKNSAQELWSVAAVETSDVMMEVVNATLDFIKFAARSVPQFDVQLASKNMSDSGYDPSALLRSFAAFNEMSGYRFGSMGFLMRASSPSHPSGAKVSWQIANGFGCPTYMYAYSDNSINPKFLGYCGTSNGVVNFAAGPAYVGSDWGLKPEEIALLDGPLNATFLPIFDLLGAFTLTYEIAWGERYAVTFAELDLTLLSNHINNQMVLLGGKALAYIYESTTGMMIASNVNGTIFSANQTRYNISNTPSKDIQDTADGQDGAWLITLTKRIEPGLNWTIVVAAREGDIKGNINTSIITASVASLFVLVALVILAWIGIHFCVVRQLKAKKEGNSSIPYTFFDELKN